MTVNAEINVFQCIFVLIHGVLVLLKVARREGYSP